MAEVSFPSRPRSLQGALASVPGQMDRAPLELSFGQGQAGSGGEAGVTIGDDQLNAGEAAVDQLAQQVGPGVLRLAGADRDAEELTVTVLSDAVGHEGRDILDRPRPAGAEEGGIEVQVGEALREGALRMSVRTSSSEGRSMDVSSTVANSLAPLPGGVCLGRTSTKGASALSLCHLHTLRDTTPSLSKDATPVRRCVLPLLAAEEE